MRHFIQPFAAFVLRRVHLEGRAKSDMMNIYYENESLDSSGTRGPIVNAETHSVS